MRRKRQLKNRLQSSVISFIVLNICNVINSWVHYYTYVYRGYYAVARRYEFYVRAWQEQYLTSERNERVRYCSCHKNIKFITSSQRVISCIFSSHCYTYSTCTTYAALMRFQNSPFSSPGKGRKTFSFSFCCHLSCY